MATKKITCINVFEEAFPTRKASEFLWYHLKKGFLIFTELQSAALKEERSFDRDQDKPCYALHPLWKVRSLLESPREPNIYLSTETEDQAVATYSSQMSNTDCVSTFRVLECVFFLSLGIFILNRRIVQTLNLRHWICFQGLAERVKVICLYNVLSPIGENMAALLSLDALKALFWNLIFQLWVRMLRENKGVKKSGLQKESCPKPRSNPA